jgi:poly(A) polymerase
VAPSFLLACLLWHDVQVRWQAQREAGEAPFPALQQAIDAVFDARIGDISGRGRLAADMREIWQLQPRLERRSVSAAPALLDQPRFRAGFDFLRLRADVDEVPQELAEWWEDYSLGTDEEREALLQDLKTRQTRRVATPRAAKAALAEPTPRGRSPASQALGLPSGDGSGAVSDPGVGEGEGVGASAPRRRRRRGGRGRSRASGSAGADGATGDPGGDGEAGPDRPARARPD